MKNLSARNVKFEVGLPNSVCQSLEDIRESLDVGGDVPAGCKRSISTQTTPPQSNIHKPCVPFVRVDHVRVDHAQISSVF